MITRARRITLSAAAFVFEKIQTTRPTMVAQCMCASIFALALDYAILFALVQFGGIFYIAASAISFITAHTIEYFINRNYIFCVETLLVTRYLRFITLELAGLGMLVLFMWFFVEILGANYLLARAVVAVLLGIFYFSMNLFYTFRE